MDSHLLFFEIEELYKGFAEANGIIKILDNKLHLQFNVKDSFIGVIKSAPKSIDISFDNILEIVEKKNYFKKVPSKISIRVSDLNLFKQIPGLENLCELELKIGNNDKLNIQAFLSNANMKIAEFKLIRACRG